MAGQFRIKSMDAEAQGDFFALAREIFPKASVKLEKNDEVLLAYDKKMAVGFVHLRPKTDYFYLQGIGVRPECRKQGLGRALLQMAFAKTTARFGKNGLALRVNASNAEAVRFYLSAGFSLDKFSERVWMLRWKPLN